MEKALSEPKEPAQLPPPKTPVFSLGGVKFLGSPNSALRFTPRHCGVRQVRLIPRDWRALNLELFTLPSKPIFHGFSMMASKKGGITG